MVFTRTEIFTRVMGFQNQTYTQRRSAVEKMGIVADTSSRFESMGLIPDFPLDLAEPQEELFNIKNLTFDLLSGVGFDLRVGEHVFEADRVQNVSGLEELFDYVKAGDMKKLDPKEGKFVFDPDPEGNRVYYVVSFEELVNFPKELSLFVDAKSTTGRVGVMCTDVCRAALRESGTSPIIVAVQPYVFPIEVSIGKTRLVQAVLRLSDSPYMSREEVLRKGVVGLFEGEEEIDLTTNGRLGENGLLMTYSTSKAFRARLAKDVPFPIDMDVRGRYNPNDFFEVIEGNNNLLMEKGRFYLLGTRERIALKGACGILSRESYDTGTGLWGHFAGIIHPGFNGGITMECRSSSNRLVKEGDPGGFVSLDRLEGSFDEEKEGYRGKYQGQVSPTLPKMFKDRSQKR